MARIVSFSLKPQILAFFLFVILIYDSSRGELQVGDEDAIGPSQTQGKGGTKSKSNFPHKKNEDVTVGT